MADELNLVSNKSRKPSREELLNELESIRSSLLSSDSESDTIDHNENEPRTESSAAESTSPSPELAETQRMPIITPEKLNDTNPFSPNNEKASDMTVLPGQQSLFDEEKKEKQAAETEATTTEETEASHEPTTERENPFLPKHIKQRLEMERSLYEREISEHTPLPKKAMPSPSTEQSPQEVLIDELVQRYLPKIEQELRERLREQLGDSGED